jgi:hypothetical protein
MLISLAESKSAAASKGGLFKLLGCLAEALGACCRAKAAGDLYVELNVLSDAELARRGLKRADLQRVALAMLDGNADAAAGPLGVGRERH